jgi:hypothetical protein
MFGNLDIYEIVCIIGAGYVAYKAYGSTISSVKTAGIINAVVAIMLLSSSVISTDTFAQPSGSSWTLANLGGLELMTVAGLAYSAYVLFSNGEKLLGAIDAVLAMIILYDSGTSQGSDIEV